MTTIYYRTHMLAQDLVQIASKPSRPILYSPPAEDEYRVIQLIDAKLKQGVWVVRFTIDLNDHRYSIERMVRKNGGSWRRWARGYCFIHEEQKEAFLRDLEGYIKEYWRSPNNWPTFSLANEGLLKIAVGMIRQIFPDFPPINLDRMLLVLAVDDHLGKMRFGAILSLIACWRKANYSIEQTGIIWPLLNDAPDLDRAKHSSYKVAIAQSLALARSQDRALELTPEILPGLYYIAQELDDQRLIDICLPPLYLVDAGIKSDATVRVLLYNLLRLGEVEPE